MAEAPQILVLGIGNLLRRDEGFGVHVIRRLARDYAASPNVTLLDGGTAGLALLDAIMGCAELVVVDVARLGLPAGSVARLDGAELPAMLAAKQSAHDWGFCEVLVQARLLGHEPKVVVIAAEPADMDGWSDELSPLLAARLPEAVAQVRAAVASIGGSLVARACQSLATGAG